MFLSWQASTRRLRTTSTQDCADVIASSIRHQPRSLAHPHHWTTMAAANGFLNNGPKTARAFRADALLIEPLAIALVDDCLHVIDRLLELSMGAQKLGKGRNRRRVGPG